MKIRSFFNGKKRQSRDQDPNPQWEAEGEEAIKIRDQDPIPQWEAEEDEAVKIREAEAEAEGAIILIKTRSLNGRQSQRQVQIETLTQF